MVGGSMEGLLNGSAGQNVNISLWNSIWRLQRLTKWLKRTIKYRKERLCLFQSGCASMKEKKRARGAFHMSMPGGPTSHYPSMGCSNMQRGVEKWQQKARRRRRPQPSKHVCKQGIYILQKSALQKEGNAVGAFVRTQGPHAGFLWVTSEVNIFCLFTQKLSLKTFEVQPSSH